MLVIGASVNNPGRGLTEDKTPYGANFEGVIHKHAFSITDDRPYKNTP